MSTSSGSRGCGHVASGLASVIVTDDAENAIVVALGANASLDEEHVHRHGRIVGDAKVLLVQLEVPPDAVRAALEIARGAATLAVLNAAPPRPIADEVLRLADVVVVNEGEAAALTGDPPPPDDLGAEWAARSAAALVARGCPAAVVTLGARGRLVCRPPPQRPRVAPHRRRRRFDGRGRRVLRHPRRGPGGRWLAGRRTGPGVGGRRPRHDPTRFRAVAPHRARRRRAPRDPLTPRGSVGGREGRGEVGGVEIGAEEVLGADEGGAAPLGHGGRDVERDVDDRPVGDDPAQQSDALALAGVEVAPR